MYYVIISNGKLAVSIDPLPAGVSIVAAYSSYDEARKHLKKMEVKFYTEEEEETRHDY